ncbi:uncharacterized protein FOMMEDRAFT_167745 [Fomitiporia mediterranea MF3/22]|uniref:uncharacterized protein n=1 Tax=Fomitiporia mediterranea (strain MF3/22) TaxID=694068 RepID=UPI0004408AAE|nr:uncharacterized protein FOMMEDRAFT_167745 [Fomitiporia mediterranea MF3/22]EJD04591.1 hypothetical protein FOMMEDRAFT_167745 [Fomitiporia mediterranea MF3/22]
MTASDLPGPGRILDKYVFTKGGRALERAIARTAHSLGFGPAAAALRIGANLRGFSLDESPPTTALMTYEGATSKALRLELGLIQDIPRLRADCQKLVGYTKSNIVSTRIQAYNMIITLFIRFPYLNLYFENVDVIKSDRKSVRSCQATDDDLLEETLARMAFACLVPSDDPGSVARLVDHLAEQTKRAEERKKEWSTGPPVSDLPSTQMIRKYCENPHTSFAALRFTGIIFRHYFLSRGPDLYVKLTSATVPEFWQELILCIQNLVQSDLTRACGDCTCSKHYCNDPRHASATYGDAEILAEPDPEGIDLFSETIFEMLYRGIAWDPNLDKYGRRCVRLRDSLVCDALKIFEPPAAQMLFPNASFISLTKLKPQAELLQYDVHHTIDALPQFGKLEHGFEGEGELATHLASKSTPTFSDRLSGAFRRRDRQRGVKVILPTKPEYGFDDEGELAIPLFGKSVPRFSDRLSRVFRRRNHQRGVKGELSVLRLTTRTTLKATIG